MPGSLLSNFQADTLANRPSASTSNLGCYFYATDVKVLYQNQSGASWTILTRPQPAKVTLNAVDTGGGIFSWVNPYGLTILVSKVIVDVTTVASGACSIDIGTTVASSTTQSDNLIDGLDIHSATGPFSTVDQAGANGKERQKLASGGWVTGSKDSGASAAIVGSAYIYHDFA